MWILTIIAVSAFLGMAAGTTGRPPVRFQGLGTFRGVHDQEQEPREHPDSPRGYRPSPRRGPPPPVRDDDPIPNRGRSKHKNLLKAKPDVSPPKPDVSPPKPDVTLSPIEIPDSNVPPPDLPAPAISPIREPSGNTLPLGGLATTTNTYIVLVPSQIRDDSTLTIPVQLLVRPPGKVTITAQLTENKNDPKVENKVIATATKNFNGQTATGTVDLIIPAGQVSWGSFLVIVSGSGVMTFENKTTVYGRPKNSATIVQSDKAVYKPGETVNYRMFTIDPTLKIKDTKLNVEIFDPKGNKIDERMGVGSIMGYEDKLQLSDRPPLGQWRIKTSIPDPTGSSKRGSEENYYFEVKEYVLPKFEVTVTLPSFGTSSDAALVGTAKAAYTFGKPVKGNIVLSVSKRYATGFFDARAVRRELPIDGEVSFDISKTALLALTRNLDSENLMVHANVTETLTGITLAGQGYIQYHSQPYKIEFFPNMPENFKPKFNPLSVLVKVTFHDGRPPPTSAEKMKITVTYFTDKPVQGPFTNRVTVPDYEVVSPFIGGETIMIDTMLKTLKVDGTVNFDLTIPDGTATASIKAEYAGQTVYKDIRRFRAVGEVFLKAEMIDSGPLKIGDVAVVKLTTTSPESSLTAYYTIVSKGAVIQTGEIAISGEFKDGSQQFLITREMAPSARFVAHIVTAEGEIIADGLNFVIEDIYENKVTIEFDQSTSKTREPKENVNLRVTADSGSQVNVLVVDKSVILMKEGNDVTPSRVNDVLGQFGDTPWVSRGWGRIFPWPIVADDSTDIFDSANLQVLTDALIYKFDLWSLNRPSFSSRGGGRMAMQAMASDAGGFGGAPAVPEGQIRKDFPETWIWHSELASNGIVNLAAVVPDTITEYVANAFALNPTSGLGVAQMRSNLTVFLPFFVSVQLPYSVIREETAIIQANVFNYHPNDLYVVVRLKASATGEFVGVVVDPVTQVETEMPANQDLTKCILVKSEVPTPVFFSVRPKKIGNIVVNVRITNLKPRNIFDEVIRSLPVKAEGAEQEKNTPVLVSMTTAGSVVNEVPISYPLSLVPQSQRIQVSVIGDVFGPSLENLDLIIRLPYGCGEQNMVHFAPSVFAAEYLRQTGRSGSKLELQEKIRTAIQTGYQRQLLYQRNDGSFSSFGNADAEGSLWLTSFVIKSFAQAHALNLTNVFIDPRVIDRAVRYIVGDGRQTPSGNFINTGIVNNKAMQGGSAENLRSLTAYVVICLQEVKESEILTDLETTDLLNTAISSATSYLAGQANSGLMITDYERAIGSYALTLVNNPSAPALLTALENSPSKTIEGNSKYWKDTSSHALEIEVASYALMTYTLVGGESGKNNGIMILNWLVKQRNSYGGFSSTQDTVVALQALSQFAALIYTQNVDMTLEIYTTTGTPPNEVTGTKQTIQMTPANHDILQIRDFDGDVNKVTIEATGTGLAMIDVKTFYNVAQDPEPPSYALSSTVTDDTTNKYILKACARFTKVDSKSNMVIMDIGVISGFEPQIDLVQQPATAKRKEISAGRLQIYFDEITSVDSCVTVPVQRVSQVAGVKPATMRVYSYYEPNEASMATYLPPSLNTPGLCDTCGIECGCGPNPTPDTPLTQCGVV